MRLDWLVTRPVDSPRTGGEMITQKIISFLRSKGWTVTVISLNDLNSIQRGSYLLANLSFIWKLLICRKASPVIIEDFYTHPWLFLFNWVAKLVGNSKIVVFVQLVYHHHQKSSHRNAIDRLIASLFLRPVDLVVTLSQTLADECVRLGVSPEDVCVIYPGCDFVTQPVVKRTPVDEDGRARLLAIANYEPRKGLHHLVQAMAIVRQLEPDQFSSMILQIVGNPNDDLAYTEQLKRMIQAAHLQDHVILRGWCNREEIQKLLSQSDLFVFSSFQEGFGMVLAEAMYYGLPIVAYRAGSVPELVEHEHNGLLVQPEDIKGLAEAILRLVVEPETRNVMGQASKVRSKQFVRSWGQTGRAFCDALAALRQGS